MMVCQDALFRALTDSKRRAIVKELHAGDRPIAHVDLAHDLTELPNGAARASVNGDDADDVYLELYHCHVPRLAEIGVMEFNEAQKTIDQEGNFLAPGELLNTVREAGDVQ